jgi:hypothetical protein
VLAGGRLQHLDLRYYLSDRVFGHYGIASGNAATAQFTQTCTANALRDRQNPAGRSEVKLCRNRLKTNGLGIFAIFWKGGELCAIKSLNFRSSIT